MHTIPVTNVPVKNVVITITPGVPAMVAIASPMVPVPIIPVPQVPVRIVMCVPMIGIPEVHGRVPIGVIPGIGIPGRVIIRIVPVTVTRIIARVSNPEANGKSAVVITGSQVEVIHRPPGIITGAHKITGIIRIAIIRPDIFGIPGIIAGVINTFL